MGGFDMGMMWWQVMKTEHDYSRTLSRRRLLQQMAPSPTNSSMAQHHLYLTVHGKHAVIARFCAYQQVAVTAKQEGARDQITNLRCGR